MQDVITLGKRLVPLEEIAFVEPFDAARNPEFKPEKEFKARVVLLNRNIVLAEAPPREFAEAHGMCYLDEDNVAVNPVISFRVETFAPTDDFKPEKSYQTRLKWRDRDGKEQSRLLLAKPEIVVAIVLRGNVEPRTGGAPRARRSSARRSARKTGPAHP